MKGNATAFLGLSSSVPSIISLLLLWSEIPAPAVGRRELAVEAPFSLVCLELLSLERAGAGKEPGENQSGILGDCPGPFL